MLVAIALSLQVEAGDCEHHAENEPITNEAAGNGGTTYRRVTDHDSKGNDDEQSESKEWMTAEPRIRPMVRSPDPLQPPHGLSCRL